MKTITTTKEMQEVMDGLRVNKQIGYVPTMGYLHEGHIQLIREAKKANDIVVVSIFVNPLQFGPNEDFDAYPRDFERDSKFCLEEGVDFIFYPSVEEMYPSPMSVKMLVQARTDVLCGESRPGHFDGVATVLTKLFHIISPHRVYLGMKDAQQVAVVKGLVSDMNFNLELIPVATVREEDGLAKSSRNVNLSNIERAEAPTLYKSLQLAKELIEAGERNKDIVIREMKKLIQEETTGEIDYIEIYSFPGLQTIEKMEGKIIIALAVKFLKARLIDNLVLTIE